MALSRTDELGIQRETTPNGFVLLKVNGWLTIKNKATFENAIDEIHGSDAILEMSGLQYMDSAGLGSLLKAYVAAQKYGGRLVLAGLVPRVRDLLQLTKIEPLFQIYPGVEEANAALSKSANA